MQFNWDEFMNKNNKIAVHCKTKKEAIDFCKKMDKHGMKWNGGASYCDRNNWDIYKEETVYSYEVYANYYFYEDEGYKILEWSDYMEKDPIDYLEYGYVVKMKDGVLGMYMPYENGSCFDLEDSSCCMYLRYYDSNLKHNDNNNNDIVAIYGFTRYGSDTRKLTIKDRPLIWERPEEVKKMTVSDICKELGYKVEIIAEG